MEDEYDVETRARYDILKAKVDETEAAYRDHLPNICGVRQRYSQLGDSAAPTPGPDLESGEDPKEDQRKKFWWQKKFSCCRMQSMLCFVSMWMWILYVLGCAASSCREYSITLRTLYSTALGFIPLCHLWVLIESALSREFEYLKKLGGQDSAARILDSIKQAAPTVTCKTQSSSRLSLPSYISITN